MKPAIPAKINAHCHPREKAIKGTIAGATIAPALVPELKILVAKALSFLGNQSAVDLIAEGKLPPSPNPNVILARVKPRTLPTRACAIAATLHAAIETA